MNILISITKLDWKPFALALAGFLCGAFADRLGTHYGMWIAGALILCGWWCVLAGLLIAKRDDLPLWKIFYKDTQ
jgi:hypothetical protein